MGKNKIFKDTVKFQLTVTLCCLKPLDSRGRRWQYFKVIYSTTIHFCRLLLLY